MKLLQDLAAQVLLGTERRPPSLPAAGGSLGELLAAACPPDADLETRILRSAGAMAVWADAGFVPPAAADELPAPCPPQTLRPVTHPALFAALERILAEGPDPLRFEALQIIGTRAACLPPRLLPAALSLAGRTPALRLALLPVLGERGRWLAALNPEWGYALGGGDAPDMDLWDHGTVEQRKTLLARLRASDPDRARRLLQEGFPQLDARERAGLLEACASGLDPADEDFLEALLADRSKEVRQLAAGLLSRLPQSRYVARMGTRMAACLGQERKFLRTVLALEAPAAFAHDWKADALEETRAKSERLGERAWWLYQIARALPLSWWPAHTGMAPEALLRWVQGTDWSEALLRAWLEALGRGPEAAWAAAFLAQGFPQGMTVDVFALFVCLPPPEREREWLRLLDAGPGRIARGELLARIVQDAPVLSESFARRVLQEIRGSLATDAAKWDYTLRKALPEFVCLIPPSCLDEAAQGWPAGRPDTEYFNDTLARVLAILEHRKTLHRFAAEGTPP